jgi:hypothetical protein
MSRFVLLSLHDMVIRQPFEFVMTFVNRGGMEADILVVGAIPESFPITNEKLRIEAPANNRCGDYIVIAVNICALGNVKKLSPSGVITRSM